ncbi:MAG TPA: alcohol dehydrogenase catalytic domain-containing protein, partial [archaeon]|nr:alcohol dehydrogenase catalytic domain-containing protein [archaeon]
MRVAKVVTPREIHLEETPLPAPGPGEVLVRVKAVGICGSDLQYYAHGRIGDLQFTAGHVLGHEVAGVIEALGPDTDGLAPGTPVVVDPAIPCGGCRYCMAGHPNLCRSLRFLGSPPTPGGLCEYLTHPAHLVLSLPGDTACAVGAISEALGVAIHAVDLSHLRLGESAAVFGCGPIGLLIARVAQLAGASPVLASEPLAHRRKAASLFGVASAYDPDREDVVRAIRERTGGDGVDVAFEAAGDPEAVEAAVASVKPGGRVVIIGIPSDDRIAFTASVARRKDLLIRVAHRMKHTYPRAIRLVESGRVDLRSLATHRFPLAEVARAFAVAERREG